MKMVKSKLCLALLTKILCFSILSIRGNILNDCSSNVVSGIVTYRGCKQLVQTNSLSNRTTESKTIYTFKGIPYGESPTGELRFRKTVPKTYSNPTFIDATNYRHPCVQLVPSELPLGSRTHSEDCLFLNVWTPTLNKSANLPVMFWIHGGIFLIGSGSQTILFTKLSLTNIFEGTELSLRDVVVVTCNYRLGVFGFLYGNSSEAPGNAGLWDQATALNWTRNNIKNFGGDPDNILIYGESSGSMSVSNHIVSNVSRNMFRKAIMESGSGYSKLFSRDKYYSYDLARRFASNSTVALTGRCDDDSNWIACLRKKTALELLLAQTTAILWNPSQPFSISWLAPFQPMFGDEFLPISIPQAIKEGNFKSDFNLLIGHNEMEGAIFAELIGLIVGLSLRYVTFLETPILSKNVVFNDIKNHFINNDTIGVLIAQKYTEGFTEISVLSNPNPIRRSAAYSIGDYFITCPTILFGGYISKNSNFKGQVFQYKLTYANSQSISHSSKWANVTHGDDLPLVFGLPFKPTEEITWNDSDRKLSRIMMDIWTYFAKYDELPVVNGNRWPPYSLNSDNSVNATYIELHADDNRLGRIFVNAYDGKDDGYTPPVIGNCFDFWDEIIRGQFGPD